MKLSLSFDLEENLFNALLKRSTGNDTPESLCESFIKERCASYAQIDESDEREKLAKNTMLIELGKRIMAAPPEVQFEIFSAAEKALA